MTLTMTAEVRAGRGRVVPGAVLARTVDPGHTGGCRSLVADGRIVEYHCSVWCPPAPSADAASCARRTRAAAPAPEVACRPAGPGELPTAAAATLLADAEAADWTAAATYTRGPLPSQTSPCAACGTWAQVLADGTLRRHSTPATACPGGDVAAPAGTKVACPACDRTVKALKSGRTAAHTTLAEPCPATAVDPDAPTWRMTDSVVVRLATPAGHRAAAAWTDGATAGAWLRLAGDRIRHLPLADLTATLRRAAVARPAHITEP